MIEAFIVTLREGVEAALVIGIAVAYLNKGGRADLVRWVYAGLAAAVVASLALGYAFAKLNWNQDRFEGWVMLAAAALVASLVYAMYRAGKTMKSEIEAGMNKAFQSPAAGPALFLFVFLMVLREGVETILLLAAVTMNSEDLWNAAGIVLGAALAVVFGVLFVRGSVRVNLGQFFRMTSVILCFVVLQLTIGGLHELSEQGIVPTTKTIMAWMGPIVRNEIFFFITILALAATMILLDWRSKKPSISEALTAADRRLAQWTAKRDRMWMTAVCVSSFVLIVLVTAQFIYATTKTALSPAQGITADAGVVRIPIKDLADGELHRYQLQTAAGMVRFFAIARAGMDPAVAVDACEVCGTSGYTKQGPNVICRNCGAAMFVPSIGTEGGCNPIPLAHSVDGGDIKISAGDLEKASKIFAAEAPK